MLSNQQVRYYAKLAFVVFSLSFISARIVICVTVLIKIAQFDIAVDDWLVADEINYHHHADDVTNQDRTIIASYLVTQTVVDVFALIAVAIESTLLLIVFVVVNLMSSVVMLLVGTKLAIFGLIMTIIAIILIHAQRIEKENEAIAI